MCLPLWGYSWTIYWNISNTIVSKTNFWSKTYLSWGVGVKTDSKARHIVIAIFCITVLLDEKGCSSFWISIYFFNNYLSMSPINITIKIQDWLKGLYSTDNACVIKKKKRKKVNWSIKALSVLFFFLPLAHWLAHWLAQVCFKWL